MHETIKDFKDFKNYVKVFENRADFICRISEELSEKDEFLFIQNTLYFKIKFNYEINIIIKELSGARDAPFGV